MEHNSIVSRKEWCAARRSQKTTMDFVRWHDEYEKVVAGSACRAN